MFVVISRINEEPIIVSFAGHHGDDEAVLQWRKEENEVILIVLIYFTITYIVFITAISAQSHIYIYYGKRF